MSLTVFIKAPPPAANAWALSGIGRTALPDQTVPGKLDLHLRAYKFVLSSPHLAAVISNMVNKQMVKENLAVVRM